MLKVWGRKTSSNVQKVMWAVGELKLAHERIDIGGPFGKNEVMKILDANLARHAYVAGDAFSIGDIPVGIMAYRFRQLVPDRPELKSIERWYAAIAARPAFHDHVGSIPLS